MKFEIDPNELTTDQRAHVAAFITNWPTIKLVINRFDTEQLIPPIPTEEQRLDAEQKSDLGKIAGSNLKNLVDIPEVNLNAIFGTPTAAERAKVDSLVPLDKEGLPWDSRIHASSKATIADGSWKLRRGVDPTEVEKVKVQLKELMDVPTPPVTVSGDHDPSSKIPAPPLPLMNQATVDIPVPGIDIDIPSSTVTLTDLIGRMSAAIAAGNLTQASVAEICTKHGVSEFYLLSNRPDLLPLIDADMKAMGV